MITGAVAASIAALYQAMCNDSLGRSTVEIKIGTGDDARVAVLAPIFANTEVETAVYDMVAF